ncbi:MAG: co-chaperone GroES [Omnitrophica bacterium]|nr:co-chaperone GroES [Candidatus Omnitrophota bacterium]
MNIKPLRGKILVEIIGNEPETKSGLYLARVTKEIPTRGICLAVGLPPFVKGKEKPWGIKVGDLVHFKRRFGTPYELRQGKRMLFLRRDEIVAISNKSITDEDVLRDKERLAAKVFQNSF